MKLAYITAFHDHALTRTGYAMNAIARFATGVLYVTVALAGAPAAIASIARRRRSAAKF